MDISSSSSDRRRQVTIVTHSPSPYQVELFDAIAALGVMDLHVVYLYAHDPQRMWHVSPLLHSSTVLDRDGMAAALVESVCASDLLVVNYFKHRFVDMLLARWPASGKPWCFWGERPRVHALQMASRLNRVLRLRALHRCRSPIWGIGRMAVDGYREEFGPHRQYVNLPYFSALERFHAPQRLVRQERVILFSGSLIQRKGVDLIATAFSRLAGENPHLRLRLRLMGGGPLEPVLRHFLRGCAEQVEFLGFRDWQVLPTEYARADILCVPSRYDGWGLVVPEGLAAGLPVISTTQTGAGVEFLETGRNGWLIPPDDEEALFQALREAAALDDTQLAAMSHAAVESVREHTLEAGARRLAKAALQAIEGQ